MQFAVKNNQKHGPGPCLNPNSGGIRCPQPDAEEVHCIRGLLKIEKQNRGSSAGSNQNIVRSAILLFVNILIYIDFIYILSVWNIDKDCLFNLRFEMLSKKDRHAD